jgi:DNA mismatch repair protein MutS2
LNPKHLSTLELPKILHQLSTHTSFSASKDAALELNPITDVSEIQHRLDITSEARQLLDSKPGTSIGGAHDVRPLLEDAQRDKVLPPPELLNVRDTLVSGRTLNRTLSRLESELPRLAHIGHRIQPCPRVISEIDRCLDQRGDVRDKASSALARIRREVEMAHARIQEKLSSIIHDSRNASYLQEALITRRAGRYVIPLKAQFKGRIPGVVHDRSASGVTLFIEPLSVVELNNAWRELQLEEEAEVKRILSELTALVADHGEEITQTVETLTALDLAFAKAKYATALDANAPQLAPLPQTTACDDPQSTIRFLSARHPLLDPERVVPIDVELDDETHILVITGPNTGGKTVSLKTVGLLTLMAQAGLHIPAAEGSALSPFEAVYADIGDEQSIEQNLSTFSSHLTNIISFLDQADARSLVLLDELGAGTDPAEGSALARALLEHFRERGATTFVATHYPELKNYAQLTPGVRNASVEFDPETLSPTYRLTIGLPGRSNALAIAQRLNLPQEIVEAAREMVSPADQQTEAMLDDIHRLRIQAAKERDEAHAARTEAEKTSRELRERLNAIEEERREILEQAREEVEETLDAMRSEIRRLRGRLRAAAEPVEAVEAIEEEVDELEEQLPEPEPLESPEPPESPAGPPQRPIEAGDTVWVRPLRTEGEVIKVNGKEAEVQVGQIRTQVSLSSLELREPAPEPERSEATAISVSAVSSPGSRIDLRGQTVEEARGELDHYLDRAMRAGLPQVRIIHGKGTGALRRATREMLASHPLVSDYEGGDYKEGGEGVTLATLVKR